MADNKNPLPKVTLVTAPAPEAGQPEVTGTEAVPAVTVPEQAPAVEQPAPVEVASGTLAMGASSEVGSGSPEGATMAALAVAQVETLNNNAGVGMFTVEGQELIMQLISTGSDTAKRTIAEVLLYASEMAPNTILDDEHGARKQVALFRCLQNAVNNAGDDFQLMFATILRIVSELKETGAFQHRLVFRFFPDMNMNKEDRDAFAALLHVMLTLCDPSGRATALRQIDLSKAFQAGYTDGGRQRLLGFFSV